MNRKDEEFIKAVQEGTAQVDAGELIEHEEAAAYLPSLTTHTPTARTSPTGLVLGGARLL